jgi:acyl-coenzyme A thioesterase PaaI-like protein
MAGRRNLLLRAISLYPPYLGAGVRVRRVGRDPLAFESEMKLTFWNRNYVGTHFGGSLYAMADPFFMLILIDALGPGFEVWDKAATIRFRRPGRGTVRARFEIARARIEEIRRRVEAEGRLEPVFVAAIVDRTGETVAEVEKLLSVRRAR